MEMIGRCFIDRLSGFGYNWMRGFSADGLPTRKEKGAFCRETAVRAYKDHTVPWGTRELSVCGDRIKRVQSAGNAVVIEARIQPL